MFVGREKELATLERAYSSERFQMVVLYGRRRVGKTTLLSHFAEDKRTLFFTAQQQTNANNLSDFCREVARFFSLPAGTSFDSWNAAFDFIADRALKERFLFVFDEFPYAAAADRSLTSKLQIAIDHRFSKTSMCLILCGSNQGFMESDVLGEKSPLHGRRTTQMRLRPFDYATAAKMTPEAPAEDAFRYYACVGGVPYYLAQVDPSLSFRENLENLFFRTDGLLFEEPLMLLRQELREPASYNSILRAVGSGANRQNEIANRAGIENTTASKYLKTLSSLDILEREVPFGENPETSRRGIYRFSDACYDFWYTFVMPTIGDIESGAGSIVAREIPDKVLDTYFGHRFERVCREWMVRQSLKGKLPIAASAFGSWWGTDPDTRQQDDIDVVAADRFAKTALIGECKWRKSFDETEALKKLHRRAHLIQGVDVVCYYLFSRYELSPKTRTKLEDDGADYSITLEDMYNVSE